jgi:hypothetical protein
MLPSNNRPNIGELAFLANRDRNAYFVSCFYAPFFSGACPLLPNRPAFAHAGELRQLMSSHQLGYSF